MNLHKQENENIEQYIWRLGNYKDNGLIDLTWGEITDFISQELNSEKCSEAKYRKPYQQAKRFFEAGVFGNSSDDNNADNKQAVIADYKYSAAETSINKDGTYSSSKLIEMSEEQAKDPEYILKAHGFDPDLWKIVSTRNTIRQAISKQEGVETLYASYITVKPISEKELPLKKIGEFFERLDRNYSLPKIERNSNEHTKGNKLLLIDIADLHMNLQASVFTTMNEYNCEIAEKLFFYVIDNILSRTKEYKFEEIAFIIGGDMLNGDNLSGSTTKGTPQVSDIHYYDAYERLCGMTVKAIDILKNYSDVNVIYVPGNHDEVIGFKLAKFIDAWFRHDNGVTVDYQPVARKYKLYGKTLLCFAHDGKVKEVPAIVANEAREYWAKADTVEVFLQHLHTEQVLVEDNNIRIQRLPTISAKSKWSNDKGYNSKRQCKSFIFDVEDGLTDVLYTPIKVNDIYRKEVKLWDAEN